MAVGVIIGVCMFFMIKAVAVISTNFHHEQAKAEEVKTTETIPVGPTAEELLVEIRDLLKDKNA